MDLHAWERCKCVAHISATVLQLSSVSCVDEKRAELVEVKKGLSRRAIEQLAYVQDINSLAVLSGV